jgi:acetoin utilization deacetylase AcuC-like enzyme
MICRISFVLFALALYPSSALTVPVWFDSTNAWHRNIQYHPEQPARIEACIKALRGTEGVQIFDVTPDPSTLWSDISHAPFSEQELKHAREMMMKAHSPELVTGLETRCRQSRQRRIEEGKDPLGFVGYVDDDTFVTTESFGVCLRATAAWIRAVDHALAEPNRAAMALTRPPGHHATFKSSNGFCLVNFADAAAIHALETDPNLKVSIFDWDVHYGQGVADIIEKHNRVRYASIHQTPAFPHMGTQFEVQGEYDNVKTIPIVAETSWSCGYRQKFENDVLPFLRSDSWEPDLVIVCAGYDALDSDELASVSLNARDYGEMTTQLLAHLGGKQRPSVALGLEGGYQLREMVGGGNLADAVTETIQALVRSD